MIGADRVSITVEGATAWGEDRVLLDADDDLTRGREWAERGWCVAPFLSPAACDDLRRFLIGFFSRAVRSVIGRDMGDDATAYHRIVADDAAHLAVMERTRGCFPIDLMGGHDGAINARVSEVLGEAVTPENPVTGESEFCLRVVRPRNRDNNPPHRDVWLDRLRNAVNIYFPIAGSDHRSSLPVVSGSHRWPESRIERTVAGARVNGADFTVPTVVGSPDGINMIRPNPGPREFMVFSPYLIHGGGANLNPDTTRMSLEMRFWRARRPRA